MDYNIIGSGSSGNCVRVGDMLFDVGLPFTTIQDELFKVRYLFITHKHSDHINRVTYRKLRRKYPRITVVANYDVAQVIHVDKVVSDSSVFTLPGRTVTCFKLIHDVVCTGYNISMSDGTEIIYATDTSSLENAPDKKYDYLFLESNHDEKKLEQISTNAKKLYGYDAYSGGKRHLSTQQSKAFYFLHRRSRESEWIELHKSNRFY